MREEKHAQENNMIYRCAAPRMILLAIFSILLFSILSVSSLATMNVMLSDQGTGVKDKTTQQTITLGNLTVDIYETLSGGSPIYTQTFNNAIKNGSWNVMLGETTPLPLEFGKAYYRDYNINGEDASFKDGTGATVDRQIFYAPLGDINGSKLINGTVTKVKIEACANGQIMKMSGGAWTCTNEAAYTDTNCSIDGSCPNIVYSSEEAALNVNSSTWWATVSGWMAGWFYRSGSSLAFNETKLNATIDARTTGLGDNASWNEGYADTKYLQTGDQRYNNTAAINSVNTSANARMDTLNSTKSATGNCPAGYAMQNTTSSGVQCISIPSLSETDPIFTSQNASIWSAINSKLGLTDQRYNDSAAISSVDTNTNARVDNLNSTKLDKTDQRYNNTAAINSVDTNTNARIDLLNTTKLNSADQRYNDTSTINSVNTTANTRMDTLNSTKSATGNCPAGYAMQNTTATGIQCISIPSLSETDPIFTSQNASIWSAINGKLTATDQRYNDSAAISSIGNWTADKANYATNTKVDSLGNWTADKPNYATVSGNINTSNIVASVGNWTLDKPSYATTASLTTLDTKVNSIGNWTNDKPSYITAAQIDTGYYNKTISDGKYATSAALTSIGNWTQDKPNYATVPGNINTSNIVASVGNWTADKPTYTATSSLVSILGNWSADKPSYATTASVTALDTKLGSVGNWTADKPGYTLTSGLAAILGNWSLDKPSYITSAQVDTGYYNKTLSDNKYATSAALTSLGNWTLDKPSYATTASVTALDTKLGSVGNWTADKPSYATVSGNINTSNIVASVGNWSADKGSYALDSRVTAVNTTSNIQNLGFVTGQHRKGGGAYLYNDTDTIYLNETKLNQTIDARDSDTVYDFQCPAGQFVKNLTSTGGYVCEAAAGSGDITAVHADNIYVYNGSDSSDVNLAFNETKLNATIDARAAAFGDNTSWNEGYADTKYLQITDQRYNDTAAISSIGNWTNDKTGYTLTSGLVAILGNWSLDKPSYTATSGLVGILGNWSLDKPNYATVAGNINTSNIVSSVGNWTLDKPSYTATSGLVAILGNWSLDKTSYYTKTEDDTSDNSRGNWTQDKNAIPSCSDPTASKLMFNATDKLFYCGTDLPSVVIKRQTADVSTSDAAIWSNTSMNFSLSASRNYTMRCDILFTGAIAGTGQTINLSTTATTSNVNIAYDTWSSATAPIGFSATSFGTALMGTGSGAAVIRPNFIFADFQTSSTGYLLLQIRSEAGGSATTLKRGSMCYLYDVTGL
jgi:hypothetical protein